MKIKTPIDVKNNSAVKTHGQLKLTEMVKLKLELKGCGAIMLVTRDLAVYPSQQRAR